jgi:hypothetical protein
MPSAKVAAACAFSVLALSACGTSKKPVAGTIPPTATSEGRAKIDDPRTKHVKCLEQQKIPVAEVSGSELQIGTPPSGPEVQFEPTPGAAQAAGYKGQVTGAEIIGSALLYPNRASDQLLQKDEDCMAQGVTG